jgi:hypothetical protein
MRPNVRSVNLMTWHVNLAWEHNMNPHLSSPRSNRSTASNSTAAASIADQSGLPRRQRRQRARTERCCGRRCGRKRLECDRKLDCEPHLLTRERRHCEWCNDGPSVRAGMILRCKYLSCSPYLQRTSTTCLTGSVGQCPLGSIKGTIGTGYTAVRVRATPNSS